MSTERELLELGLRYELEAKEYYLRAVEIFDQPGTKAMLQELAEQEAEHAALFEAVLAGRPVVLGASEPQPMEELGLAERLATPVLEEGSDPSDVIVIAMKKELAAIERYEEWARDFAGTGLGQLAASLAAEERGHKYRLERLYDEEYLKFN